MLLPVGLLKFPGSFPRQEHCEVVTFSWAWYALKEKNGLRECLQPPVHVTGVFF